MRLWFTLKAINNARATRRRYDRNWKHTTIGTALLAAADRYADHPLFVVPENPNRDYDPNGLSLSFAQVAQQVLQTAQIYQEQGYGFPHHVALFLENQSAHLIHKLALNHIGACCVPVNPSYKTLELVYLFEHAKPELVVVLDKYLVAVQVAVEQASHKPHIVPLSQFETLPAPKQKHKRIPCSQIHQQAFFIPQAQQENPKAAYCLIGMN